MGQNEKCQLKMPHRNFSQRPLLWFPLTIDEFAIDVVIKIIRRMLAVHLIDPVISINIFTNYLVKLLIKIVNSYDKVI